MPSHSKSVPSDKGLVRRPAGDSRSRHPRPQHPLRTGSSGSPRGLLRPSWDHHSTDPVPAAVEEVSSDEEAEVSRIRPRRPRPATSSVGDSGHAPLGDTSCLPWLNPGYRLGPLLPKPTKPEHYFRAAVAILRRGNSLIMTFRDVRLELEDRLGRTLRPHRRHLKFIVLHAAHYLKEEGSRQAPVIAPAAFQQVPPPHPPEFYKRAPTLSDLRECDRGYPNWPRPQGPRTGFLRYSTDVLAQSLSRDDHQVLMACHEQISLCGRLLDGYPLDQKLDREARQRLLLVECQRSRAEATRTILAHSKVLPFCSLDSESRLFLKSELSCMPDYLQRLHSSRVKYVAVATALGTTIIYCMANWGSIGEAVGPEVLALFSGKNPDVPVYYVVGVAIWEDEAALGIKFAFPADLRGLLCEFSRTGFLSLDLGEKNGLKTLMYAMYGETTGALFPSSRRGGLTYTSQRDKFISFYRTDPGPLEDIVPARDILSLFRLDGTRKGLQDFQAIYISLDVLVPVAAIFADVIRFLKAGKGLGMSLSGQVIRSLFDCQRTYVPPPQLSHREGYYRDFYGSYEADLAQERSLSSSSGARKRLRKRLVRERMEAGSPGKQSPPATVAVGDPDRMLQEFVRQSQLPPTLEARRAAAKIRMMGAGTAGDASGSSWTEVTVRSREGLSASFLERIRRFARPYVGQTFLRETNKCAVCGRHSDKLACLSPGRCHYPLCDSPEGHELGVCPTLHDTCPRCSFKGHGPDFECQDPSNLQLLVRCFLEFADLGRWTQLRYIKSSLGALSFVKAEVPQWYMNDDEKLWDDAADVRRSVRKPPCLFPPSIHTPAPTRRPQKERPVPAKVGSRETIERRERRRRQFTRYLADPDNDLLETWLVRKGEIVENLPHTMTAQRRRLREKQLLARKKLMRHQAAEASEVRAGQLQQPHVALRRPPKPSPPASAPPSPPTKRPPPPPPPGEVHLADGFRWDDYLVRDPHRKVVGGYPDGYFTDPVMKYGKDEPVDSGAKRRRRGGTEDDGDVLQINDPDDEDPGSWFQ